jgi:lysophospholipase L1-like esterase
MAKNRYVTGYTEAISTLQTAFPNLKVVLISPTWRLWYTVNDGSGVYLEDSDSKDWGGGTLIDYCESLKNIADELHVKYVDAYNIGINRYNYPRYFNSTDGTHHDVAGRRLLAEYLARQLIALG